MPELPDLEVIKENLYKKVTNKEITELKLLKPSVAQPDPKTLQENLPGKKVTNVDRRGKYLILGLSDQSSLLIHLMLEGQLDYQPSSAPLEKGTCALLLFCDGFRVSFIDERGWMKLRRIPPGELSQTKELSALGPEPFDPQFTPEYLKEILTKFRGTIKHALMEQGNLAGIGNAYADEILFCAHINPARKSRDLTERERDLLYHCIKKTLCWGIEETRKRIGDSVHGEIREFLRVHRKEGIPCPRCKELIRRVDIEGRGTYFCPSCQK